MAKMILSNKTKSVRLMGMFSVLWLQNSLVLVRWIWHKFTLSTFSLSLSILAFHLDPELQNAKRKKCKNSTRTRRQNLHTKLGKLLSLHACIRFGRLKKWERLARNSLTQFIFITAVGFSSSIWTHFEQLILCYRRENNDDDLCACVHEWECAVNAKAMRNTRLLFTNVITDNNNVSLHCWASSKDPVIRMHSCLVQCVCHSPESKNEPNKLTAHKNLFDFVLYMHY